MTTTTVLSEDTATIVQNEIARFDWGAVLAGAVVATAVTFFLVSAGSGLGLALTSARHAAGSGIKTFLALGAIYFVAAEAFGLAVGGHITGRLMGSADASEEEAFRADAHGLAVWALAVLFGLGLMALAAGPGLAAGATSRAASTPVNYWVDKLFRPATTKQSFIAYKQYAQNGAPTATDAVPQGGASSGPSRSVAAMASPPGNAAGAMPPSSAGSAAVPTVKDAKAEASRILTVGIANGFSNGDDKQQLARLVSQYTGLSSSAALDRVGVVENEMKASTRDAAEAARKAASYVSIWTALALLFGAIVSIAATIFARSGDDRLGINIAGST
jgi:hypothetical protein